MGHRFSDIERRVDANLSWETCPSCQKEFSGLNQYRYTEASGEKKEIGLCCLCSSYVTGIEFVRLLLPLPGSTLVMRQMGKRDDKRYLAAIVDLGELTVTVIPAFTGFSVKLKDDPDKKEHSPRDPFEAWAIIRRLLIPRTDIVAVPKKRVSNLGVFNYE